MPLSPSMLNVCAENAFTDHLPAAVNTRVASSIASDADWCTAAKSEDATPPEDDADVATAPLCSFDALSDTTAVALAEGAPSIILTGSTTTRRPGTKNAQEHSNNEYAKVLRRPTVIPCIVSDSLLDTA